MIQIFLCIDFDRDAAFPFLGYKHAISKPRQNSTQDILRDPVKSAAIQGSIEGFDLILSYLIQNKIPAVFYFEARTIDIISKKYPEFIQRLKQPFFEVGVHGYDHEDLVGEDTGIVITKKEEEDIIAKAKEKMEELFSTKVVGFRAPYMRVSQNTYRILKSLNFSYDSSSYLESDRTILPFKIKEGLTEFPVIKTPKNSEMKGMYTYLWPLFEGKRNIKEILNNYRLLVLNSTEENSYLSINLHSWHFAYNVERTCYNTQKEIKKNSEFLVKLIEELEKLEGIQFSTPMLWLEKSKSK